ncbi:MAG: ABC transporter permease [Caldilineaceae bacterium]|nr:ABC transporter permease [Caldilineaceae bacterium]
MRALLIMTLNDLRIFFSQPGNWLGLGLVPVLFTVGLGFAFGGISAPETVRVDLIDADHTAHSSRFLEELRETNETLVFCPHDSSPYDSSGEGDSDPCDLGDEPLTLARGQERVREGDSAALIVIPAGYGAALQEHTSVQIDFYSMTAPTSPDPVRQTLDAVLQRLNSAMLTAGVADAMLDRLSRQEAAAAAIAPWRDSFMTALYTRTETLLTERPPAVRYVTTGGAQESCVDQGFGQSVPGVGSMYVMFTVFGGMALLQRERQRWTLQRLAVFPLTRGQILGGKILTYFTLGMAQYLLVFGVGLAVGLDFGPNPALLLLAMAAFVLCCTALTFAIAPLLASEQQAGVMTQLLSLSFASLGGAWWPLEIVPEFMQFIGHLTPVAWVMDAFRDLLFYGGGLVDVLPEIGVLLAAAALLFGIGIWRFRYV